MDLAALDLKGAAEEGAWLVLRNPVTNAEFEGRPRILLRGADSPSYAAGAAESAAWRLRNPAPKIDREKMTGGQILEEMGIAKQSMARDLAAVTVAWEGIEWEGEALECSRENAIMLYTEREWVAEQAFAFIKDRAAYLGKE